MKKSNTSIEGKNVRVGDLLVNRLIPAEQATNVGPFLLLDHGYPIKYQPGKNASSALNEHPHRGLVAITYVIKGEVEHFDSLGNHETAADGCAHWLSAGNGAIHGERVSPRLRERGGTFHAIQFWTNIPAAHKADDPHYQLLDAEAFPMAQLPGHGGLIHVLIGKCGTIESPVESLSKAFLYRITLNAKSEFQVTAGEEMKSAVFVPDHPVIVNGELVEKSQLLIFPESNAEIVLRNPGIFNADAFILGGPEPDETIVVQGPFVMNSQSEISKAYRDFFDGKYGTIKKVPEIKET